MRLPQTLLMIFRFILILGLITYSPHCASQTCTPNFQKTYGGNGVDEGLDAYVTAEKGAIIVGRTTSDYGNYNGYLMKITEAGAIQWVKAFGGDQYDELTKVRQTSDGGFIAVGSTKSFGLTVGEAWIVKTDAAGNHLWSRHYGKSTASLKAKDVIQLTDGSYALLLNTNDSTAQGDGIVIHTSSAGAPLWVKRFDNGGRDGFNNLIEDGPNLFVSGFANTGTLDGILMRIRVSDGTVVSAKKYARRQSNDDEVLNIEKIPGGYAFSVYTRLSRSSFQQNDPYVTFFKMTDSDSIYHMRLCRVLVDYVSEHVNGRMAHDSGFVYFVNDTLPWTRSQYCKISPSGMAEWRRATPPGLSNNSRRISDVELFSDMGYLFTGTVKAFALGSKEKIQVLKTDDAGRIGTCTNASVANNFTDTTFFQVSAFNWSTVTDETLLEGVIQPAVAPLNFTESQQCGKTDCNPSPIMSDTTCFSTFLSQYKGFYNFVPFDAIRTNNGYFVAGYHQQVQAVEAVVMKIRLNGTVAWTRSFSNLLNQQTFAFIQTSTDGNLLIGGRGYWTVDHGMGEYSHILKLSPNGDVLWKRQFFGQLNDLQPADNGEYVGTMTYTYIDPDYETTFFKINESGDITYQKQMNTSAGAVGKVERIFAEGRYLYTLAEGYNLSSIIISKWDSTGLPVWRKRFTVNGNSSLIESFHMRGDSLYAAARVFNPGGFTTKQQLVSVRIGKDGGGLSGFGITVPDLINDPYPYYFPSNYRLRRVTQTSDNNMVFAERFKGSGNDSVLHLVKTTPDGQVLWVKRYPNLNDHILMCVRGDNAGLLVLGYQRGTNSDTYQQFKPFLISATDSGTVVSNGSGLCRTESVIGTTIPVTLLEVPMTNPITPSNQTYLHVESAVPLRRDVDMTSELSCGIPSDCSLMKVFGPDFICNYLDTIVYKTRKNPECNVPATWVVDTNFVQLIHFTDTSAAVRFKKAGFAKVYATMNTGCGTLKDSITVAVQLSANTINLGKDTIICPGNTVLLNARKGYASYIWQDGSTDSTFAITQPGKYFVTVSDACGRSYTDTIDVLPHPPIPFAVSPDRSKCNRDTLQFSAPSGFLNYTWSPQYNISSTSQQTVVVNPSVDTAYYVKAEKTPGCFAYDTIRVNVRHSPAIDLGTDASFCSADSLVLNAGSGFSSYTWNGISGGQTNTVYTSGMYSVIGTTTDGCRSYDTIRILDVWALPVVSLNKNSELCFGSSRTLNAGAYTAYQWQDGSIGATYTISDVGKYWVQVIDNHNCIGSDTVDVNTILPLPKGFLPFDTAICSYGTVTLKPLQSFNSYTWSTGSVMNSITIDRAGEFWLQVVDQKECVGRDTITVNPKQCMTGVYIPTAFTPNRDGKNDEFKAIAYGVVKKFELTIYNRWGQIIFYSTNPMMGWDGKVAGVPQATGVFVWTCRYQFEGGALTFEKGTMTLIQ
jgi:gliding motility-associated-like protein